MKKIALLITLTTLFSSSSFATLLVSTDKSDFSSGFSLVKQDFNDANRVSSALTSLSGEITVDQAFGHPNWYGNWTSALDGYEYAVNDWENIDITIQSD